MSDENTIELAKREARAFGQKDNLNSLWQESALNFYAARADFTTDLQLGDEYAIDQYDDEPERCRRDLADARSSMLRPDGQEWVKAQLRNKQMNEEHPGLLDYVNERLRFYLETPAFGFNRSEKEADNDLVTFGNAVKTVESEIDRYGKRILVCRSWHLRDTAWIDDETGSRQDVMFRRFKASARHIRRKFPEAMLHENIIKELDNKEGNPDREFSLCHIMMPSDEYGWYNSSLRTKAPWASVYYDSVHKMILRERPSDRFRYVVDRWMTIGGSCYGYSPSAMVSLPTARGLQVLARIFKEASEKSLDPPVKLKLGAVVGDVNMMAAGQTFIDEEYNDKLGPAIETLLPENRHLPIGIEMIDRATIALRDCWYLSKLRLPTQAKTAFETQALLEQFIRENIPLFGPWQDGETMMIDEILAVLMSDEMRDTAFYEHPIETWPEEITHPPRKRDGSEGDPEEFIFTFKNPLRDAIDKNKSNLASQVFALTVAAAQLDQDAIHVPDIKKTLEVAIRGLGGPAEFLNDEDAAKNAMAQSAQARNFLSAVGTAGQVADVAKTGSEAAANLQGMNGNAADSSYVYGPG